MTSNGFLPFLDVGSSRKVVRGVESFSRKPMWVEQYSNFLGFVFARHQAYRAKNIHVNSETLVKKFQCTGDALKKRGELDPFVSYFITADNQRVKPQTAGKTILVITILFKNDKPWEIWKR